MLGSQRCLGMVTGIISGTWYLAVWVWLALADEGKWNKREMVGEGRWEFKSSLHASRGNESREQVYGEPVS